MKSNRVLISAWFKILKTNKREFAPWMSLVFSVFYLFFLKQWAPFTSIPCKLSHPSGNHETQDNWRLPDLISRWTRAKVRPGRSETSIVCPKQPILAVYRPGSSLLTCPFSRDPNIPKEQNVVTVFPARLVWHPYSRDCLLLSWLTAATHTASQWVVLGRAIQFISRRGKALTSILRYLFSAYSIRF